MLNKKRLPFKNRFIADINKPFDQNSLFGDKLEIFADNIQNLIQHEKQSTKINSPSLVISIDSSWGMGKTTFIDRWGIKLINDGETAIKFDAWKFDHNDDPGLSFISEICRQLEAYSKTTKLINSIKRLSLHVIPPVKAIVSSVATSAAFLNTGLVIPPVIDTVVNESIDLLSSKFKPTIEQSHKQLSSFTKNKTLYVFIDELDRCNPNFALKLLEIIKHLFNVKGICFILTLNKLSLSFTIQKIFGFPVLGQACDNDIVYKVATGYLDRLFDYQLRLPEPDKGEYAKVLLEPFLPNLGLLKYINKDDKSSTKKLDVKDFTLEIFRACCKNLSLRDIEKLVKEINFFLQINAADKSCKKIPEIFISVAIYLLSLRKKSYEEYKRKAIPLALVDNVDYSEIFHLLSIVLFGPNLSCEGGECEALKRRLNESKIDMCEYLSEKVFNPNEITSIPPILEYLIEKLEFMCESIF